MLGGRFAASSENALQFLCAVVAGELKPPGCILGREPVSDDIIALQLRLKVQLKEPDAVLI